MVVDALYSLKTTALNLPQLTRAAGILLILAIGALHMYLAPMHFQAATYLGAAFVVNFAASLVAAWASGSGRRTGGGCW